jgi:dTDP-D-glucose 4,6-dehydratase
MQKNNKCKIRRKNIIDVWGEGEQTRIFLYIDDYINGTKQVFESEYSDVFNVDSEE